jgi:hypothetical protein
MDFSIILIFFPYLLFLIATTPNFFASQKNEGRKGKEMKKMICTCLPTILYDCLPFLFPCIFKGILYLPLFSGRKPANFLANPAG